MRNQSLIVVLALLVPLGIAHAQGAPAAAAATAPASAAGDMLPASAAAGAAPGRFQVGLAFLPMLLGKVATGPSGDATSSDLDTAYGLALSFGYRVFAGLSVGVGPQILFHLSGKDSAGYGVIDSEREYDIMARIAYAYAVAPKVNVYAELLPGYAFVTYHVILLGSRAPNARGMVLGGGLGASYDVTPRIFANLGIGYQTGSEVSHGISDHDVKTKFLRIALGGGVKL